jgi:hypothetical protein
MTEQSGAKALYERESNIQLWNAMFHAYHLP